MADKPVSFLGKEKYVLLLHGEGINSASRTMGSPYGIARKRPLQYLDDFDPSFAAHFGGFLRNDALMNYHLGVAKRALGRRGTPSLNTTPGNCLLDQCR